jgi:hypothetical protein
MKINSVSIPSVEVSPGIYEGTLTAEQTDADAVEIASMTCGELIEVSGNYSACEIIDEYLVLLCKHQWAGTAHGGYGTTARKCPECGGIHPDDSLNNGGGSYTSGTGHKPDCRIALAIAKVGSGRANCG